MLSENLKRLMKEKGITQHELARRTGVSQSAICFYCIGSREPKIAIVKVLADSLGVTVDELVR